MLELKEKTGTAIVLITHDLGVVAETAQRVVVMYAGRKVEEAPVEALFDEPLHPYTRGLMRRDPAPRHRGRRGRHAAAAAGDPRPGAVADPADRRLRLRAALRLRHRPLPRRAAAVVDAGAGHTVACWEVDRVRSRHEHGTRPRGRGAGEAFPDPWRALQRRVGEVRAVDGVSFAIAQGRDAGAGGRIRAAASRPSASGAEADRADRRPHPAGRRGRHASQARRHVAASPAHPDDLPGPLFVDESRGCPRARSSASRWRISASPAAARRDDRVAAPVRARRAAARRDAQVRPRILRRPAPAPGHRQGACRSVPT